MRFIRKNGISMKDRGFTLVEMSIVILVIGVLSVPLLRLYLNELMRRHQTLTQESLNISSDWIFNYGPGQYPCPARMDLPPGNPQFGIAACPVSATSPAVGTCSNGICRVNGGRDVDGDGVFETVLVGMVPIRTLNADIVVNLPLADYQISDGWHRRLTYAVTENLTDPDKFNSFGGAIHVEDENGILLSNTYHYLLISHGDNGAGAYNENGILSSACLTTTKEGKNCDLQGRFVSGLRSLGSGSSYYDDQIKFVSNRDSAVWGYSSFNTIDDQPNAIYNLSGKKVGIGIDNPQAELDIGPVDPTAPPTDPDGVGSFSAVGIHTGQFCDKAGDNCYDPEVIAGDDPNMQCPAGQAVTSIGKDPVTGVVKVNCAAIAWTHVPNCSCDPGTFVVGVSNLGNIQCCTVLNGMADSCSTKICP